MAKSQNRGRPSIDTASQKLSSEAGCHDLLAHIYYQFSMQSVRSSRGHREALSEQRKIAEEALKRMREDRKDANAALVEQARRIVEAQRAEEGSEIESDPFDGEVGH